jgi:hypothetical protein
MLTLGLAPVYTQAPSLSSFATGRHRAARIEYPVTYGHARVMLRRNATAAKALLTLVRMPLI